MKEKRTKIIFAGTPACTLPVLRMLAQHYNLCGVLTNPPARIGRSRKKIPSAVMQECLQLQEAGILDRSFPIFTPKTLNAEARTLITRIKPDILISFAYGKIFGPKFLALFPLGGINIHPSLLPLHRGAAPIPAAILAGDNETGISIQRISQKIDCGNILLQKKFTISPKSTTESLLAYAAEKSAVALHEVLSNFTDYCRKEKKQNEQSASYCTYLKKQDGKIIWGHSAQFIDRQIRAFTPWPGTYTFQGNKKILILKAHVYCTKQQTKIKKFGTILGTDKTAGILVQTGNGILAISQLQWGTKKPLFWKDFLNGSPQFFNAVLG